MIAQIDAQVLLQNFFNLLWLVPYSKVYFFFLLKCPIFLLRVDTIFIIFYFIFNILIVFNYVVDILKIYGNLQDLSLSPTRLWLGSVVSDCGAPRVKLKKPLKSNSQIYLCLMTSVRIFTHFTGGDRNQHHGLWCKHVDYRVQPGLGKPLTGSLAPGVNSTSQWSYTKRSPLLSLPLRGGGSLQEEGGAIGTPSLPDPIQDP